MKKVCCIIVSLFILPAVFAEDSRGVNSIDAEQNTVYVCTGGSSKRYHKYRSCFGLNNCGGQIKEVSLQEAKRIGRTPCKICYK